MNSFQDSEEFSVPPVPPSPSTPSQSINDSLKKRFPVDTLNIKGEQIMIMLRSLLLLQLKEICDVFQKIVNIV